ncbi:hypothetical protein VPH35_101569 [Triticum aestivum]
MGHMPPSPIFAPYNQYGCARAAATPEASSDTVLGLERTLPLTGVQLEQLKILDREPMSMKTNVAEYSLGGTPVKLEEILHIWSAQLYCTRVKLGTPPKEYTLHFDTGSDLVWVSCTPCTTAESGYYVSDTLYFDKFVGQKRVTSSASIFFGYSFQCSNSQSYQFQTDGIIGFGQNAISAISQLNSQGVSSKVFSHCLRGLKDGSKDGGGILVVGEVMWTGLVFTLILPSEDHYNVNMKGIAVNGKNISLDSSWLTTSNAQGTIVDSGTTLVYLADGVYDPVITAINDAAHTGSINSFIMNGSQCYHKNIRLFYEQLNPSCPSKCQLFNKLLFYFSISNVSLFPTVTLYFDGGASMTTGPKDYLVPMFHYDGLQDKDPMLCIGFQPSKGPDNFFQHTTILGDIVLRDMIFMYNLETKQIG